VDADVTGQVDRADRAGQIDRADRAGQPDQTDRADLRTQPAGPSARATEPRARAVAPRAADAVVVPALYDAVVTHVRRQRVHREFANRVYLWLVDLDDLPRPPRWLRPFAQFSAADHLGRPDHSIRQNLDAWLAGQGVDLHGGRVLMLANARVLGYVFNPISVYWCHRPDGGLECVVAEVHNTYGERHAYLLRPDEDGRAATDKVLYVSPFLELGGHYVMRVPRPDLGLSVTVALRQEGSTPLTATLRGTRMPATTRSLLRMVLRRPLMPQWVSAQIRRHGIVLWLRRLPIVPRTPHVHQEGVR
jgi:DUF1365 family protein